uniref:MHC class I-like antigen recognition-like domain-containing protein n=1 Tax=Esox lucius TaxID=8010 RepID=A0AAY5KT24_ESOLU
MLPRRWFLLYYAINVYVSLSATHTLQYFYTGTSGIPNFPEFMTVGMVDGYQIDHYDSITKRAVQKAEWISGAVDPEYWNRNTQIYAGNEPGFKSGIDILKSRFNQTEGE